jgi:hypothetical protein
MYNISFFKELIVRKKFEIVEQEAQLQRMLEKARNERTAQSNGKVIAPDGVGADKCLDPANDPVARDFDEHREVPDENK